MNKKELMEVLDISQTIYNKLLNEGMPSENAANTNFSIDKVTLWRNNSSNARIKGLIIGQSYSNDKIAEVFKCAPQGGMRRSHTTNSLVLILDHTGKSVYEDEWVGSTLYYTGMGSKGDQTIERTQNKTLANSNSNKVNIYLFETHQPKLYTYTGMVKLVGKPYTIYEKDSDNRKRLVYKFPLKVTNKEFSVDEEQLKKTIREKEIKVQKLPFNELEKRAQTVSNKNEEIAIQLIKNGEFSASYRTTKNKEYIRDAAISAYIKELAQGICQLCEQPAPFKKEGKPFLHSHHIEYLSNGGLDTIENCIAVCPNCHARIHELEEDGNKQKLLIKVAERKF